MNQKTRKAQQQQRDLALRTAQALAQKPGSLGLPTTLPATVGTPTKETK